MKIKLYLSESFFYGLYQLLNVSVPLMLLPVLTRKLNASDLSNYFVIYTLIQVAFLVTDFGYSTRMVAIIKNINYERLIAKIHLSIIIKLLISIPVILIANFYLNTYLLLSQTEILLVCMLILFQSQNMNWVFHGLRDYKKLVVTNLISKTVYFSITIFLLLNDYGFISTVWGLLLGSLFLIMLQILNIRISIQGLMNGINSKSVLTEIKESYTFVLSRLVGASYSMSGILILGYFKVDTTIFALSEQVYKAFQLIGSVAIQTLYPRISGTGNPKNIFLVIPYMLIFILIVGTFYINAEFFISFLFDLDEITSSLIFKLFMILCVLNFLGVYLGYPALSILNKEKSANSTVYYGVLVFFIMLTIHYDNGLNALNIISSILVAELTVLAVRIVYFCLYNKKSICK